jgi:hypothetical protein
VEWAQLADKVEARQVAAARVGKEYLIPLHGILKNPSDLDDVQFPSDCAVKAAHGSGWNLLVCDGSPARPEVVATCRKWMSRRYGDRTGETWYFAIPHRVIVEQLLVDRQFGVPLDFKCFVFHGRVRYIQVDADRFTNHVRTFYDRDWRAQPWGLMYPRAPLIPRPSRLDQLIELAETLSAGMDFIRIDLYCVNDRDMYFGEFTLSPEAGWGRFWPDRSVDERLGDLW